MALAKIPRATLVRAFGDTRSAIEFEAIQAQALDVLPVDVATALAAAGAASVAAATAQGTANTALADAATAAGAAAGALAAAATAQTTANSKAAKGANSDITSLTGLTTALNIAQGGTGAITAPLALAALGGAAIPVYAAVATDADFTITRGAPLTIRKHTGTLTANRAVTLSTTGAVAGDQVKLTRTGAGAFNLTMAGKALVTNTAAEATYDGAAWYLSAYGAL
jgi:hypothetical protein